MIPMLGKILRGTSVVFASQVLGMVTQAGLLLLLTRYLLQPSEYGLLFLTLSVLGILMLFANLGLTMASARYINDYREKSPELVPIVIKKTLLYNGILIVFVCTAIFLYHDTIAAVVGEPAISALLLFGIGYIVTMSFKGDATYFFYGFNNMKGYAAVSIVSNVLLLVAVPAFIYFGFGLEGALSGYALAYGLAAILGLAIIYRKYYSTQNVSKTLEKQVSRRLLKYSAPLTLTMGSNVINSHADRILLGVFRGPEAIAFYTLGKQISDFLIVPARSLGIGSSPTLGEQKANDEEDHAARLYEEVFRYTVAIYAPAAAGVVLIADPMIRLVFGSAYAGAVPVLQIFSVFMFVRALNVITSDGLDYLGRANMRATAKASTSVGNIVLNVLLIPPFGIIGATIATVLTYSVYVAAQLYLIMDELPIDKSKLLRSGLLLTAVTGGMSAVVFPLTGYISSVPSLIGVIFVGGVAWFILIVLSGVVDIRNLFAVLT
ncbi:MULTISPECIES: flippase [Haloferax]|uniref:Oligosaccharide flippase family protein n=1 Tax=Haloferax marinum TaxID=2666143 RepID=A0A6A8GBK6_9EURY|nr:MULTISPECIES: flippase [Haloferax]KAB1198506.1 flippase [Haloferax sp. CBA1150]MRW97613.1 oligosaccharide flippase family protein [Haloferax marinum]